MQANASRKTNKNSKISQKDSPRQLAIHCCCLTMIQDKMVRARRQYHHYHHHRAHKRSHVPNAPSNTTQFIMNDHELIEPDFDLMHSAIMEHYNRSKRRKLQNQPSTTMNKSPFRDAEESENQQRPHPTTKHQQQQQQLQQHQQQQQQQQSQQQPQQQPQHNQIQNQQPALQQQQQEQTTTTTNNNNTTTTTMMTTATQLQESTNQSNPTTPNYRPTGSPGDEDGLSPFINHEHLHSEFQEAYANIHTERLNSMSKNQLVDKYLLLEERVEELENQLRECHDAADHNSDQQK
jgi:hypothetical protein